MDRGIKINLIKKIAKRLQVETDIDGDLTLGAFDFPRSREWHYSDGYEFYATMLSSGKDHNLIGLHDYLFPGENLPQLLTSDDVNLWNKNFFRVFISHSTTKKLLTSQLKKELAEYGIDCFVAHEDIEPTSQWLIEIKKALNSCNCLVAILCSEFPKSKFCDQELGYALSLDKFVIPVRVEIDPYGFMAPLQGVKAFTATPGEIASDIVKILEKNARTTDLLVKCKRHKLELLVGDFLNSSNFSSSTELLKKIENEEVISPEVLEKIDSSWINNDQIYNCGAIPKRMGDLFKKHHFTPIHQLKGRT